MLTGEGDQERPSGYVLHARLLHPGYCHRQGVHQHFPILVKAIHLLRVKKSLHSLWLFYWCSKDMTNMQLYAHVKVGTESLDAIMHKGGLFGNI